MGFEVLIDLLDSLESGYFAGKKPNQWPRGLKKLGIKKADEAVFLEMIGKILQLQMLVCQAMPPGGFALRVYNPEEQRYLSPECRGLLLHFERIGLLPPELREVVIDQVIRIEDFELDGYRLRVLILLVLFHQSGLDAILSHYEHLPQPQGRVVH